MKKKDYVQTHYTLDVNKKAQSASFWKGFSLFAVIVIIALICLCFYILNHKKTIGYVVEIDKQTGVTTFKNNAVLPIEDYKPSDSIVQSELEFFTEQFWGVTVDENIQQNWIKKVYARVEKQALSYVDDYYKANPPLKLQKNERRDVKVYNKHRINDNTYEVLFEVSTYSATSGKLLKTVYNKASMHIRFYSPRSDYDMQMNPNGIYIDDLSVSVIKSDIPLDIKEIS